MYIIAADQIINGQGNLIQTDKIRNILSGSGYKIVEFEISSSKDGWNTPLPENRLRCACAPMIAMIKAQKLFSQKGVDAIVIHGKDLIKSDFHNKRDERNRLMQLYGNGKNGHILQAYNQLAHDFLKYWKISQDEFRSLAEAIFENHFSAWRQLHPDAMRPASKWFGSVTDLFRGVDCANPSVDFEGCIIIGTQEALQKCNLNIDLCPQVTGCHVEEMGPDSLDLLPKIATYHHLKSAFEKTCEQAHVDFKKEFLAGKALLEVYTCYPVVPLGFLLATGMVDSIQEVPAFLKKHPITITGGLNLAKAPFNNTTLSALVSMTCRLREKRALPMGGIHSVGATGYQQAFVILQRLVN